MTALVACAALVVLVLAAVALALLILRLLDAPSRPPRPPWWAPQPTNPSNPGQPSERGHVDRRHGWCEVCGIELRGPQLHEVIDAGVDDDGILTTSELMGGGTAMVAEFCAEHCPGGCRHPHPTGRRIRGALGR